jgi:hypothetical protein
MPIRPSERARYPKDWPEISLRIREREGNRCAWCGAPNGQEIRRLKSDPSRYVTCTRFGVIAEFDRLGSLEAVEAKWLRPIRVVLTVAHLDHTPEHCADDNLVALCQRCHLAYDAKHHATNAAETRQTKRDAESGQTPLFGKASP